MNLVVTEKGRVSVIQMPARLMMADAPAVRSQISQIVDKGKTRLVFNLSQVELMDSSGLSTLVTALKQVDRLGGRIVLASPSEDVQGLLEITQMHQVFEIFENTQSAVTRLQ